ncbi:MAG: GPW/gp25 family protein [Vicinamibacterales bacterium]
MFNTARTERRNDFQRFPLAQHSVLNYGLPALSGRTASSVEVTDLERGIRQAIVDFEPRILASTLRVKAVEVAAFNQHNVIGVQISGQLWAQPVPIELMLRTEIDLETGRVEIADLASRGV